MEMTFLLNKNSLGASIMEKWKTRWNVFAHFAFQTYENVNVIYIFSDF